MPSDTYTLTISDLGVAAVADNAVTTAKIANYTIAGTGVTAAKIESYTVAGTGITTAKIADDAVTTAKILNLNVTTDKIAAGAVTDVKLATSAVTTVKIADLAVTSAKIAATTITDGNIAAGAAIALSKLATGELPAGITVATAAACTGNAATATTATNLSGATAFTIPYQTAASATGYIPVGAVGQVLQSNAAAAPTWVTVPFGTVAAGGTGITSYATGDILFASVTNVLSKLPAAAAGNVLLSGTTPLYGKVILTTGSTQHVTGTLPVDKGGTGVTAASTGSGGVVLSSGPTLVAPVLGTPAAGSILTNCTGLPLTSGAGVTGILPVAYGGTGTSTGLPAEIDTLTFDTTPASGTGALTAGKLRWNQVDNTLDLKLVGDVTLQIGQESNLYCHNSETTTITNGTVVYIYGADGTLPAVKRATNTDVTSDKILGVATQNILAGAHGYITTQGLVRDLDTSGIGGSGTPMYLGTAGALTSTRPSFPAGIVRIGTVVVSDVATGSIYVQPQMFQDGRTSGQFAWVGNAVVGPTITVAGMTSTSNVIIQQRNATTILPRSFGAVCGAGSFIPYADQGTNLDTKLFSYIAFI